MGSQVRRLATVMVLKVALTILARFLIQEINPTTAANMDAQIEINYSTKTTRGSCIPCQQSHKNCGESAYIDDHHAHDYSQC